jgi:hypothetical protein
MLITVYQKTTEGFRQVNQFYWWRVELVDEIKAQEELGLREPSRHHTYMACPGCGRRLSRQIIRQRHQCAGTLTDRPVVPRRSLRRSPEDLVEYLTKNPFAILSD